MEPEGDSLWIKVKASKEILKYVVPKGFITVDGTSLTVVDVFDDESCFNFMLVSYTQQKVVIPLKRSRAEGEFGGRHTWQLIRSFVVPTSSTEKPNSRQLSHPQARRFEASSSQPPPVASSSVDIQCQR
ncbi:hypothetical protein G4B88_021759 [Cannabis sativa]|uniref:Lumazine-binding domain-containing protein n=1 Tax=Cannabis sativa TaxID=3483 RepID=A0A7J6EYY6_CANSA|nr:hypothetical protein G4B88_021759 [Cannabis sativa]